MASVRRSFLGLLVMAGATFALAQSSQSSQPHVGRVSDWTQRHVMVSGGATTENLKVAAREPRVMYQLSPRVFNEGLANDPTKLTPPATKVKIDGGPSGKRSARIDWSVNLGTGVVPANMFPAKFGFDINGAPDCTNDYVVYGLNVTATNGGQANLVGINNLYSGTGGLCGANPNVRWAYNGSTVANGKVLTSPVVSLDGTKVAYVESAPTGARFHVLTWRNGEGTVTNATNPRDTGAGGNQCTAATNCLTSITLSATSGATFASPWVDYASDKAFVATDDGKIYRISCVFFCTLNTNPSIDWTFTLPVAGTGGATPRPNGPVYYNVYGRLFIGDQLGEMWVLNAGGITPSLFAGPVMVGGGGCTVTNPPGRTGTPSPCTPVGTAFGIPDPIVLDASGASGKIFAFTGNNGTNAVVAQMNEDLTGLISVPVGEGGVDIHTGAFDDAYFGSTPNTGELFLCGTGAADTTPYHYWIGFASYPVINSTPTGNLQRINAANVACAPYTELFNPNLNLGGNTTHHDLLISGLVDATNGYIITNDISTGSIPAALNFVQYPGGISGVIIDNISTAAQASSVYFSTLGQVSVGGCTPNRRCAVKLTQGSLQ